MRFLIVILATAAGLLVATVEPAPARLGDLRTQPAFSADAMASSASSELPQAALPTASFTSPTDTGHLSTISPAICDQDPAISDAEIAVEYEAEMAAVRDVQARQRKLLRCLVEHHGVSVVHVEGMSEGDLPVYRHLIRVARRGILNDDSLLRLGAAGQMLVAGELAAVAPAEEEAAFSAADPSVNGQFDGPANDAREAAVVRRLVASGPLAVIVLGAAHDLSEHVRAVGNCEYVRVCVRRDMRHIGTKRRSTTQQMID